MRIATWNVNSLKQRMPRFLPWLDERRPDVVCLQETKLADDALAELLGDELAGRGYAVAAHGEAAWNGVAILSRVGLDEVVMSRRTALLVTVIVLVPAPSESGSPFPPVVPPADPANAKTPAVTLMSPVNVLDVYGVPTGTSVKPAADGAFVIDGTYRTYYYEVRR